MPPPKKLVRERLSHFNGAKLSPRKAIKRVAAIALSPVKARPQKKNRNTDPEDEVPVSESSAANIQNEDVFLADANTSHHHEFHQGSMPEPPTAAPPAFVLQGRINLNSSQYHGPHQEDDRASPTPRAPSILEHSDDDNDLDSEIVPPEEDELCVPEAGNFGGDGYPRPAPPKTFVEKMAALGTKQFLAVAPDSW
ncbi:hypothetical protein C8F04DRAFT_1186154 [Mycena alexandri]|uniref:Uncharacterized protein n=1 Tax=Mycena alexandri TaxID=1745969 RepID=A0AAD6X191_9AGAR|nr:hypothetical protein C8F04DRAFT_1186154 [Mycena alexandri]